MKQQTVRLSIDVTPVLRKRLKIAATIRGTSLREYCLKAIENCLETDELAEKRTQGLTSAQLSAKTFIRDWTSDEDSIYDNIS